MASSDLADGSSELEEMAALARHAAASLQTGVSAVYLQ